MRPRVRLETFQGLLAHPWARAAIRSAVMIRRSGNASMKDVAALAGVSIGTVSNVLNAPAVVAEGTRERVEQAIAKLGWVRNESARQLRAGQSMTVGMIVMDIAN